MPESLAAQQNSDVLTLGDEASAARLAEMASKGDLRTPGHAGAWVVISSVALGVGRDTCGLPEPPDTTFMATPALDGMTPEQITVLNRMVTANFRSSESAGSLDLGKLYPITRQSVLFLGWNEGKFDCAAVSQVWEVALAHASNRRR